MAFSVEHSNASDIPIWARRCIAVRRCDSSRTL